MPEHDPHYVAGHLRDHLANHNTPIVFLFGAGASSSIVIADNGSTRPLIPTVAAITAKCESEVGGLGTNFASAWTMIRAECAQAKLPDNVESVLSRVRGKIDAIGDTDTSCGLTLAQLKTVESSIAKTIVREVSPEDALIPQHVPHDVFARWVSRTSRRNPIEIFTTNYDTLLERSLENARVPLFDGFIGSHDPFFAPEVVEDPNLMPPVEWVRLWKLHGSINWRLVSRNGTQRVVRSGNGDPQLILPSHLKYIESRKEPYLALTDRLSKALRAEGAVLVSVGFSFADQHLNNIIFDALDANPVTHLIGLMRSPLSKYTDLQKHAVARKNVVLIARDGAVIAGQAGKWATSGKTAVFSGAGTAGQSGEMLIGDFDIFTRFLSEMDPSVAPTAP